MDSTDAGRSEVSSQRGRREGRAGEGAAAHAQAYDSRHQANFGWDWTGELVFVQVPAQRRVASAATESVEWRARSREERSECATRAERGASGPRRAAVHAHALEPRHLANFGWDWAGELVLRRFSSQHRGASALKESRWKEVHRSEEERGERTARVEGGASGQERSRVRTATSAPSSGQLRLGLDR